jgi:hypothetical protein
MENFGVVDSFEDDDEDDYIPDEEDEPTPQFTPSDDKPLVEEEKIGA